MLAFVRDFTSINDQCEVLTSRGKGEKKGAERESPFKVFIMSPVRRSVLFCQTLSVIKEDISVSPLCSSNIDHFHVLCSQKCLLKVGLDLLPFQKTYSEYISLVRMFYFIRMFFSCPTNILHISLLS